MVKVKFGTKAELACPVNLLLLDNKWPLPPSRRRSLIGCLSNPFSPGTSMSAYQWERKRDTWILESDSTK